MSNFERNRMIAQLEMLEKGVIPFPTSYNHEESMLSVVRKQLNTLTQEEQRLAKRKFRKLHRKVAKYILKNSKNIRSANSRVKSMSVCSTEVGGSCAPFTRTHKARNHEVWSYMVRLASEGKL